MRFLMVSTFYPPHHFGGDAVYVRQLSDALRALGHDVDVVYCYDAYKISGGNKGINTKSEDEHGDVRSLNSRLGFLSPIATQLTGWPFLKRRKLQKIFDRQYDVVHFHNISLIGGPGLLPMSRAPVTLFTAHEHWTVCATHIFWKNRNKACDKRQCFACQIRSGRPPQLWRYTNLLASSFAAVDHIFAPSKFTKKALQTGGIKQEIEVLKLFAPSCFETMAPKSEKLTRPMFLYVGRITRSKGVVELVNMFKQRPSYLLKIVGEGDILKELKNDAANWPNIQFVGPVRRDELPELFRAATAVVVPSLAPESFGLATIEGFSQATPAIVRDSGGAGELIEETGAGVVFRTEQEALAAIDKFATNTAHREEMGEKARTEFEKRYTQNRHLSAYLDRIENLSSSKVPLST